MTWTEWVVWAALASSVVCLGFVIYFNREAAKAWRRAEADWKCAAEAWERVARRRDAL